MGIRVKNACTPVSRIAWKGCGGGVNGGGAVFHDIDAYLAGALGFKTEAGLADLLGMYRECDEGEEEGGAHD